MKKVIVTFLFAGVVLLLGWHLYQGYASKPDTHKRRGKRAVAVEVEPVQRKTIRDIRAFTGSLRASSKFIVAPKVGGRLEKVSVHIGESVRKGQLLARIAAGEYRQQVEEARADLQVSQARIPQCLTRLNLAEMEFKRMKRLREKKIASAADFDVKESELKTVQAELSVLKAQKAQKEAALKAAQVRLGYTVMKAIWHNGSNVRYVGERFVDEGQMLMANTPILSVVDIKTLNAVVHVIERDYPRLRQGQEAVITTDAYSGIEFPGTVSRISNVLKESTRQAEVEVRVPNPDLRLKPGMFVRVLVELARHANAIVIPATALIRYQGRKGVFLLSEDQNSASFAAIQEGIQNGDWVEVISPLLAGRVVTLGHHLLHDGAKVVLAGSAPATGSPAKQHRQ